VVVTQLEYLGINVAAHLFYTQDFLEPATCFVFFFIYKSQKKFEFGEAAGSSVMLTVLQRHKLNMDDTQTSKASVAL